MSTILPSGAADDQGTGQPASGRLHASDLPDDRKAWVAGTAPVAVVMISLNEAHNMEAVLQNLAGWAQEVFLVDSYSVDDTVDIALCHGVRVVQRRFRGFGDQWNFALRELPITAPWTMKLDPDERLDQQIKDSINQLTGPDSAAVGLSVCRRLWFMGRVLPVRQHLLRVWRTGVCRFSDVKVNEHPLVSGPVIAADGVVEHHDSPDLHHWLAKQNDYTTMEAVSMARGEGLSVAPRLLGDAMERRMWVKKNFFRVPGRYLLLFAYNFAVLGAWRAGRAGYTWARLRCQVYRLREYKRREIRMTGRLPKPWSTKVGAPDPRVQHYE